MWMCCDLQKKKKNQKVTTMGKHHPGRLAAIVVSVVGYSISLVFNGLSVVGIGKSMFLLIVY